MFNRTVLAPSAYKDYVNGSSGGMLPNLGWDYPSELQHMVLDHWRSYPSPPIYYKAFFFIGHFVMMLLSVFGNGLVLWIFGTSKNLRTPSNILILNLAIFDLIMCLNMPHYFVNAIAGYVVGGELSCDLYANFGAISGTGSAITNAFIAYDRYKTISNPIDGRLNFGQIGILVLSSWLWTIPFTVLPTLRIWGRYVPEGYQTICTFDYISDNDDTRFYIRTMFCWCYCVPMIVIVTSYFKLFLHVRDHERMLAEQAKKMNVKSLSANANADDMSVEMRIAKAAMIIYMMYIFSWTPYATVALLSTFDHRDMITPFISMLPATCAKLVSCLDPWVYAASHPKYRAELERRVPWLGITEKSVSAPPGGGNASLNDSETGTVSTMDKKE